MCVCTVVAGPGSGDRPPCLTVLLSAISPAGRMQPFLLPLGRVSPRTGFQGGQVGRVQPPPLARPAVVNQRRRRAATLALC